MTRKKLAIVAAQLVGTMLSFQALALAQKRNPAATNAALQARERMLQSHRQSGSIAGGYRPYSTWSYQNSARTQAQALNAYGESCPQVPPATAKEHLTEIRRNLAAATEEITKVEKEPAKDADVHMHVDAIHKHYEAAAKLCDRMEKAIGEENVDCAEMCACCAGIDKELQAAEAEHQQMLDKIGIKLPAGAAHQHGDAEGAPAKEKDKKNN